MRISGKISAKGGDHIPLHLNRRLFFMSFVLGVLFWILGASQAHNRVRQGRRHLAAPS